MRHLAISLLLCMATAAAASDFDVTHVTDAAYAPDAPDTQNTADTAYAHYTADALGVADVGPTPAWASNSDSQALAADSEVAQIAEAIGLQRFNLGANSTVVGWHAGGRWFFGHHDAEESDVGFVWQGDANQTVVIGAKGVTWSRRF